MKDPQKPISDRKADELEEKEAPRRASVFSGGEGEVTELEEKEAPRRASLVGAEGEDAAAEFDADKALELEEKEAPRRASVFGDEGGVELEEKEAPRAGGIDIE